MLFTKRAITLFAFGGAFVYFLSPFAGPGELFLFYNLLFLVLMALDFRLTPGLKELRVLRLAPTRLSLGASNGVVMRVENLSARSVQLEVRDDYPHRFSSADAVMAFTVAPRATAEGTYHVTPPEKGEYAFGTIHVRADGPLGFIRRQYRLKAARSVSVYPNIGEIGRYELMARKGRLREIGMKPSRVMGLGTEFESLKEYEQDDDFRRINWKATARKGKLISSRFEMERTQNVLIMIDAGRLMAPRIKGLTKVDHAMNAALMLSYVAMKNDDRVGLLTFSGDVIEFLPPGKGRRQMNLIIEALRTLTPRLEEPDYGKALRYLALRNRKRSLVIVFTDVIDLENSGQLVKYLAGLRPAHLPLCVTQADPALSASASQDAALAGSVYEKAVAGELIRERAQALGVLGSRGVLVMDAQPGHLTGDLISRYLEIKLKGKL